MVDNITAPGTGAVIAFDEVVIGGVTVQAQRVKPVVGADGAAADVHDGNPMPTYAAGYARVIASGTITRPANATAYAAGGIVGVTGGGATGRFAFANFARANNGVVRVDRIRLYKSQATLTGSFNLWLYRGDPAASGVADQAVASAQLAIGNAAAATRMVGRILFDFSGATLGSDGAEVAGVPVIGPAILAQAATAETALYGVLVAASGYTPLSGETFSAVAEGYAF